MDDAYDSIHTRLADLAEECAKLLEDTEDPDEHELLLDKLSTAFVAGALFLRANAEDEENAADHLVTDTFSEIVRRFKPERPSELDGLTVVHASGGMTPDGVSLCQDWVIRYAAEQAKWEAHSDEE